MKFRDLKIGQSFDWIDDSNYGRNSFFLRCYKISARKYQDSKGATHTVGSVSAKVFHVGEKVMP